MGVQYSSGLPAIANYAPRPVCDPGSIPFDNRGRWECRELVRPKGGAARHGKVTWVQPTKVEPAPTKAGGAIAPTVTQPILKKAPMGESRLGGNRKLSGFGGIIGGLGDFVTNIIPGTLDDTIWDAVKPGGGSGSTVLPPITTFTGGGLPGQSTCPPGTPGCDPTPTTTTPAERSVGQGGFEAPMLVQANRLECLPAPDGGRQVLYYSPLTKEQVCLPARGGAAIAKSYGYLRKWKPRPKAVVSAADKKLLGRISGIQKKYKALAQDAGWKCTKKGG